MVCGSGGASLVDLPAETGASQPIGIPPPLPRLVVAAHPAERPPEPVQQASGVTVPQFTTPHRLMHHAHPHTAPHHYIRYNHRIIIIRRLPGLWITWAASASIGHGGCIYK